MENWEILIWISSLFLWALFIISFTRISVKNVNRQIKNAGLYYLSTEDKVGFTLLSMALAAVFPAHWAQKAIPPLFLDAKVAKKYFVYPRDRILGVGLLLSSFLFFFATWLISDTLPSA